MPTLDWIGKAAVVNHHQAVPFRLLRPEEALSVGPSETGNLLVEGDNLKALKALLPYYAGQVKCIYIDPPYNTGNEGWVYNDNVNAPEIADWLHKTVGKEAEDLSRHDKWLCMMYPRLQLLRQFLRDDGAIFISIDDNEVMNLRAIMDEIFAPRNFIATIVWQKKQSPQNDAINLSDMHDYIVVYAKYAKSSRDDPKGWQRQLLSRGDEQEKRYSNPDDDPRGPWTSVDYTCNKSVEARPNLYYAIINPKTNAEIWPSRKAVWRYDKRTHERNMTEGRVWWGVSGTSGPRLKRFRSEVSEGVVPYTWWSKEFAGTNQEARKEIRAIFDVREADFETPKPTRLIRRILQLATDKNSLILDSFAGSGTTGHAVLQLNKEDRGNRRFLLVEMEAKIARSVTAERLRRVICGVPASHIPIEDAAEAPSHLFEADAPENAPTVETGLGGGFRFCTLGEALFDEMGQVSAGVTFRDLARHLFYTETGAPLPDDADPAPPLVGCAQGTAIYLLWHAQDALPLSAAALRALPPHDGPKIVYAASCRLSPARLRRAAVTFRQFPYDVRTS